MFSQINPQTPYIHFSLDQWEKLADNITLDLEEQEVVPLLGFQEYIDSQELNQYYAPLVRLIKHLYKQHLDNFHIFRSSLHQYQDKPRPFIIGITGSVSVGKSTFTRILRRILEIYFAGSKVVAINTDGFLYPLNYLKEHNLLQRKGFPESYNSSLLIEFLQNLATGKLAKAPVYSHITYDIVPNQFIEVFQPDIVVIEGLNILQDSSGVLLNSEHKIVQNLTQTSDSPNLSAESLGTPAPNQIKVTDFLDFSIYVDAKTELLKEWYVKRFLTFRQSSFKNKDSYFKKYADLNNQEATELATEIWETINEVNLFENILPTKEKASLIVEKGSNHKLQNFYLKKNLLCHYYI